MKSQFRVFIFLNSSLFFKLFKVNFSQQIDVTRVSCGEPENPECVSAPMNTGVKIYR